jgi:hypothetical protein
MLEILHVNMSYLEKIRSWQAKICWQLLYSGRISVWLAFNECLDR